MAKKIGIIGLGSIGARHARNLMEMGCYVVAYDPKMAPLPGFDATIKQSDAIIIASPTNLHVEHIMACQEKPTFVEKPIGDYTPALWKKHVHNVKMVGYMLRFHGCVKLAKLWLDEGYIGQPIWARFAVAQHSDKYDELILNWASHEIDLATYLLGPSSVMAAVQHGNNVADMVIRHFNGCQTTIHADYITSPEIRNFDIIGTEGRLKANLENRIIWFYDEEAFEREAISITDTWDENYNEEIRAFLDRIDGKETLGCTAREALHVLDLCLDAKGLAGIA